MSEDELSEYFLKQVTLPEGTEPIVRKLDVTAANGVEFRVVFLPDGMSVNRPAANRTASGKPLVEFYDARKDHTPDGQFVADYYLDTILPDSDFGLALHGGVDAWQIDGATMATIRDWLRSQS